MLPVALGDRGEKFTASLRRNWLSERMFVGCSPLRKSAERVFIFEDQVVGGRQDLFPGVREAFFEVGGYSELFTDGIEQIGCPLKRAGSVYYGDWPPPLLD